MDVDRVLLAAPRGFCAGVEMAIKALAWMVGAFEPPVYCYHQIVHNAIVVKRFESKGVVFIDDIAEVPPGAPVMLSAHGSAPEVVAGANARGGFVVDAVCPLVTKVHHEVRTRAKKDFDIIYIAHEGHEEAIGTVAEAPEGRIHQVESIAEIDALEDFDGPVALLTQTTLSQHDWALLAAHAHERFPEMWMPGRKDLCFATTNRQDALIEMAHRCDAVIVIGSENSSNTRALARIAADEGCARVLRVNGAAELPDDLTGTVGVTAGASAPDELVTEVIDVLAPRDGVEEVHLTDEDEYFPPPRSLRPLINAVSTLAAFGLGTTPEQGPRADDRRMSASRVLAGLTER